MNLIVIIGAGAVGKMTVGQELMKLTDYRLFHNHMMIEPVIEIFGKFNGGVVQKLRKTIFEEYIKSEHEGMIFTFMWAFDMQSDWDYIKEVSEQFEASGGTVYYVELVADRKVRVERNKTENRLRNKASKRDLVLSEDRMLREEAKHRLESKAGEITFPNYIKIDNTNLTPRQVARQIKESFGLPDINPSIQGQVYLEKVNLNEIELLHNMQVESFWPLYEKYQDEISPALETRERIEEKARMAGRTYFFIVCSGARVGAVSIVYRDSGAPDICDIGPIFILPRYQNRGFAYSALQILFEQFGQVNTWRLKTVSQEEGACHLYEKCGFVRAGEPVIVNERMDLVYYQKEIKKN